MPHHPSHLFLSEEVSGFFILQALTLTVVRWPLAHLPRCCSCPALLPERLITENFHTLRQESADFLLLGKLGTTVHKHPSFQENNRSHDHLFLEGSIATHRHLFLEAFLISSIGTPISTLNALCLSMFIL